MEHNIDNESFAVVPTANMMYIAIARSNKVTNLYVMAMAGLSNFAHSPCTIAFVIFGLHSSGLVFLSVRSRCSAHYKVILLIIIIFMAVPYIM